MQYKKEKCPYNDAIHCYPHQKHCHTCGWNPDVSLARLVKICNTKGIKLPDCVKDSIQK